jgi:hypothetical protein
LSSTVVSQIQPQIDNLTAVINSFISLADLYQFIPALFDAVERLNSTNISSSFFDVNLNNKIMDTINLDVYQPNLYASGAFIIDFQNYMSVMYKTAFASSLSQNKLNALAVAIKTPVKDSVKNKYDLL